MVMSGNKRCNFCEEIKSLSCFSKKSSCKDGHATKCKSCHNKYCRETWYPKNKIKQRKSSKKWKLENRAKIFSDKTGCNLQDVEKAIRESGGLCDICGTNKNVKAVSVDHCHKTLKVRGMLCGTCNTGLGLFKDDVELLNKAIIYLRE